MVYEHGIEPHVTVFDKSARRYLVARRLHLRPPERCLALSRRHSCARPERSSTTERRCSYSALQRERAGCAFSPRCCPNTPARKVPRSIHEGARNMARHIANSWEGGHLSTAAQKGRDALRSPQTYPQARSAATERTDRRSRRVPARSHRTEPQETRKAGSATKPHAA